MRIRWYPRWGAWGTATGPQEFATQCVTPDGEHKPTQTSPWSPEVHAENIQQEAEEFVRVNQDRKVT